MKTVYTTINFKPVHGVNSIKSKFVNFWNYTINHFHLKQLYTYMEIFCEKDLTYQ